MIFQVRATNQKSIKSITKGIKDKSTKTTFKHFINTEVFKFVTKHYKYHETSWYLWLDLGESSELTFKPNPWNIL